jgi:folylpolyglutamate synthase/dihydropteroate synthase
VQAATSRAATPAEMAHVLSGDKHSLHFSIEEGIESAITECQKKGELLVVTGSFYLMKDAHQFVNEKSFP